jgi:hypothetical protein
MLCCAKSGFYEPLVFLKGMKLPGYLRDQYILQTGSTPWGESYNTHIGFPRGVLNKFL